MSDYNYSDDEDYANEENWIYVEDHYDDADDLAEHTCPSPTTASAPLNTGPDWEPFDYFEDLTYLSDAYQDENLTTGKKRKTDAVEDTTRAMKKRRRKGTISTRQSSTRQEPCVIWMSSSERLGSQGTVQSPIRRTNKTFSLLKDWRQRFANGKGLDLRSEPRRAQSQTTQISDEREEPSSMDEDGAEADDEDEALPDGPTVDLNDLQSVASLLGDGDNLSALKEMLSARGIDSEALDVVLADLIAGRDPEYASEEEEASDVSKDLRQDQAVTQDIDEGDEPAKSSSTEPRRSTRASTANGTLKRRRKPSPDAEPANKPKKSKGR